MAKHFYGTPEQVLALGAYIKLMRAAETVTANAHRHLAEARLTPGQFGVLEALHHLGPLHQHQLGKKLLRSSGNITTVVDNLVRSGLVRRQRDTGDRRLVAVHLTEKGRKLIVDLFPRHAAAITREMAALSPTDQAELARLCRQLGRREAAEANGESPVEAGIDQEAGKPAPVSID